MPRPLLLGIVGDSAAGKTTIAAGLVRILGSSRATYVCADHYHRYDRQQRAQHGLTPLSPESNYLDVLEQHLLHLRHGEPILKPVYDHSTGTFGPVQYVQPARQFTVVDGLLGFHSPAMRDAYDIKVFLDPAEELRRRWYVQRDCSVRGYTTDQALEELDREEADSDSCIRPQRRFADLVISFAPGKRDDQEHLDAELHFRPGTLDPDLESLLASFEEGVSLTARAEEVVLRVDGTITAHRSAELQEEVWARLAFASHLRSERLGEFMAGSRLQRSESLAVVQLLLVHQLATARAAISLGASQALGASAAP